MQSLNSENTSCSTVGYPGVHCSASSRSNSTDAGAAADVNIMLAAEIALDRETSSGSHCSAEQGGYRSVADHSLTFRALQRFTMVAHFVCVLFTGYVVYTSHQPSSTLFSWHPTLMALAFTFFMAEAILVFSPQSSLLQQRPRKTKVTFHWLLMVCSAICAVSGFAVIYYNKELRDKPHLTSWHGICGTVTVVYVVIQCSAGINLLYPQMAARFVKLATLKQMHATSALLLFLIATLTLVTGMFSNWFTASVTGTSWYACVACPLLLLLIITNQIKNSYLQK